MDSNFSGSTISRSMQPSNLALILRHSLNYRPLTCHDRYLEFDAWIWQRLRNSQHSPRHAESSVNPSPRDQRHLLYQQQTLPAMSEPANVPPSLHLARPPFRWWVCDYLSTAVAPSTATTAPPEAPRSQFIKFLHPAYDSPGNIMFTLPAVDTTVFGGSKGVHHGVALTACRIIAGNAPGYLSTLRNPPITQNPISFDHVLAAPEYFFHLTTSGDPSTPYPICPEFRSWAFPHDCLPTEWDPVVDVCNPRLFLSLNPVQRMFLMTCAQRSRCSPLRLRPHLQT